MRKIFILLIITLFITLAGCQVTTVSGKHEEAKTIIEENLPAYVDADIDLQAIAALTGATITWKSGNAGILTDDGKYVEPLEETVTLTASITIDGVTRSFDFEFKTPKAYDQDFSMAWDYLRKKIKSPAGRNLTFAYSYLDRCQATYESDNQDAMSNDGVINKKEYDQDVTLTTTITCGGVMRQYQSNVTVSSFSDSERTDIIYTWLPGQVEAFLKGQITKLPSTHPQVGGLISYSSPILGLIKSDGRLIRPMEVVNTEITAEISYGLSKLNYKFQLGNFGGLSEKEFLDEWLSNQVPEVFQGSSTKFNPIKDVNGNTIDYSFASQVRTNDYGVVNLFTGQDPAIVEDLITGTELRNLTYWDENNNVPAARPIISQADLDRDMYPGYQIPNDDGVMWIVIHESGMPAAGNTADVLNRLMHSKITNPDNGSSWHFSVDEHQIIQSLPLDVIGWHAGGTGTPKYTGYNRNSIGIEMAINSDGNYEGAMHNDAKLVAYLLDRYNLTLANVKRHYDSFGKICPIIMINTNRYTEFIDLVATEMVARKFLKDATVTWTISDPELLIPLSNGMYANLPQATDKTIDFTLVVDKADYHFEKTFTVRINKSNNN